MKARIRDELKESSEVKLAVLNHCLDEVMEAVNYLIGAINSGKKLLLCGNGGSAADCQHIAAELVSVLNVDFNRPSIPAIALTTDTSIITASANDFGFNGIFARQVSGIGSSEDVLIAISTSGNSKNVLAAAIEAKRKNMIVISLTGHSGGKLSAISNVCVKVPSQSVQRIQEAHITIGHILCGELERALYERNGFK